MQKLRVGLLFGGRSVEHEVSIVSATSMLAALDQDRYEVSLIAVDLEGQWHLADARTAPRDVQRAPRVFLPAAPGSAVLRADDILAEAAPLDVLIPIIHGRGGEDGTLQGLLDLANIAYVGSGVLSSALQMDKDVAKRVLQSGGLPVTPWRCFRDFEIERDGPSVAAQQAAFEIGLPVYVKPANSGSSIGISRATSISELVEALDLASRYDRKVLVESAIDAREIEVAVMGNDDPKASVPGEIRAAQGFYDYDAKYLDDATELIVPAELDTSEIESLQSLAIKAYGLLEAEGMARVDFLLDRSSGQIFVNELNSLPGFTDGSMYPKLWEASGLSYSALLDRLIELALDRHDRRGKLETKPPTTAPVAARSKKR